MNDKNAEFKALAQEFSGDLEKTATEFDSFLDSWSGYDKLIEDAKEKYNITGELNLSDLDRKVWISEKF